MTKIQTVQKFVAADGKEFDTRAEAQSHNKFAPRLAALDAGEEEFDTALFSQDDRGNMMLSDMDLNTFLAANGDLLIKLLTPEPTKRASRKAKEAVEA